MQVIKVKSKKLLNMKMRELNQLTAALKESPIFIQGSFVEIGRAFLKKVFEGMAEIHLLDFEQIRRLYLEDSGAEAEETPAKEHDFYKMVCSTYLFLDTEPRYQFYELFKSAQHHLGEIADRLKEIDRELAQIRISGERFVDGIDRLELLQHYKELNLQAKEEIITFLSEDIESEAKNRSLIKLISLGILQRPTPYLYAYMPREYEVRDPLPFTNVLDNVVIREIKEVKRLYAEDKAGFLEWLTRQIEHEEIVWSLSNDLSSNHVLFDRSSTLKPILDLFTRKDWFAFANLAIIQIEGILTDICLLMEYGEDERKRLEKKLVGEGFGEKLDRLKTVLFGELDYEYFRFRFRVMRNRIAHGRLNSNEVEILAGILLFDLKKVCDCVRSLNIPVNRRVSIAGVTKESLKKGEIERSFIVQNFLLNHIPIPSFYNLDDLEELLKPVFTDVFWNHFEEKWDSYPEENQAAFREFLIRLKVRIPELAGKTNELLKKLKCNSKFTQKDYLDFEMKW